MDVLSLRLIWQKVWRRVPRWLTFAGCCEHGWPFVPQLESYNLYWTNQFIFMTNHYYFRLIHFLEPIIKPGFLIFIYLRQYIEAHFFAKNYVYAYMKIYCQYNIIETCFSLLIHGWPMNKKNTKEILKIFVYRIDFTRM